MIRIVHARRPCSDQGNVSLEHRVWTMFGHSSIYESAAKETGSCRIFRLLLLRVFLVHNFTD